IWELANSCIKGLKAKYILEMPSKSALNKRIAEEQRLFDASNWINTGSEIDIQNLVTHCGRFQYKVKQEIAGNLDRILVQQVLTNCLKQIQILEEKEKFNLNQRVLFSDWVLELMFTLHLHFLAK